MKSTKEVTTNYPQYKTLINAVVRSIGKESIMDVVNHGADAGFPGFTYYTDTHAFAMRYRKLIVNLLEETADQMGIDVVEMVKGFGVFRNSPMDQDDKRHLYQYLGGGRNTQSTITNVMAWFALEEVCRMFDN